MELTETERTTRVEEVVRCLINFVAADVKGADRDKYRSLYERMVVGPDPEQTPYQKHMAEAWPDIRPGSTEWIDRCKGWNAAIGAGIAKQTPGDKSLPWVAVSALEALKEPVV